MKQFWRRDDLLLQLVQSSEVRVVEGVPSLEELYSTESLVCIATKFLP